MLLECSLVRVLWVLLSWIGEVNRHFVAGQLILHQFLDAGPLDHHVRWAGHGRVEQRLPRVVKGHLIEGEPGPLLVGHIVRRPRIEHE